MVGVTLGVTLGLAACRPTPAAAPADTPVVTRAVADDAQQLVARVNGAPLLREDVALQLGADGDARRALDRAIDEELLAQEAVGRGLTRDPVLQHAQRRALAQRLIGRDFVERLPASAIPRRLVERAYELNRSFYVRPEVRELVHILAIAGRKRDAEYHRRAQAIASRVHALASARPLTAAEFSALGERLKAEARPIELHVETLSAAPGETVPAFSAAAFALKRVGEVSAVVPTAFGYHTIYLKAIRPGHNTPLAAVENEVRRRILDDARRVLLDEHLAQLRRRSVVRVDEDQTARALGLHGG